MGDKAAPDAPVRKKQDSPLESKTTITTTTASYTSSSSSSSFHSDTTTAVLTTTNAEFDTMITEADISKEQKSSVPAPIPTTNAWKIHKQGNSTTPAKISDKTKVSGKATLLAVCNS